MPVPVEPSAFDWLTTEKAAGLIAIIAAIGAYVFGGKKREKTEAAAAGGHDLTRTNELLEELLHVIRGNSRRQADDEEARVAVLIQIRDYLRVLGGEGRFMAAPTPPRTPRRPRKPKA